MDGGVTLWAYALSALLFGLLAIAALRGPAGSLPRASFALAAALTALWALAVAGIDPRDLSTRLAEGARNIAWLAFMFALLGRERRTAAIRTIYGVAIGIAVAGMALAFAEVALVPPEAKPFVMQARLGLRMIVAVTALLLVRDLFAGSGQTRRGGFRLIVGALAGLWTADFVLYAIAYAAGHWPANLVAARGLVMVVLAPLFMIALQRDDQGSLQLSRTLTLQSLSAGAVALYIALMALASGAIGTLGGQHARLIETAFVFGTTAAFITIVSTPWLRAWTRVTVAKHFFRHRYEYRAEWLRCTETLAAGHDPLEQRVARAIAEVTASPAALLLVPEGDGLAVGAGWNWRGVPEQGAGRASLALLESGRIVALDAVRAAAAGDAEADAVPGWLTADADAWAIVPLLHVGRLVGAVAVARPPIDRALDWEDFDILGAAGRQAASVLAADRAHAALAEAQRFEEFNRRFAFIMHDLKNVVSQLTLTARNAERHADNPAFRADMVATLQESAERMNVLLARLSQQHLPSAGPVRALDALALAARVAASRRAQHPVRATGATEALALADAGALETLLGHLVQNAIEASAPDATVTIDVAQAGAEVGFIVTDQGCGMAPAFVRDHLFKPFASTKAGGFGIGAFEARQLVEAMGGRIEVRSREREGTRFGVFLPAAAALGEAA